MRIKRIPGGNDNIIYNKGYYRLTWVAVCDDNGNELYRLPVFVETLWGMNIIVDEEERIAFVKIERPVVVPFLMYAKIWKNWKSTGIPHPIDLNNGIGITHLELPGGYADSDVLKEEGGEETGRIVEFETYLMPICPSTIFFSTSPEILVGKATPLPSGQKPKSDEGIKQVVWIKPEEAMGINTYCALTLAALTRFRVWALKQPSGTFWHNIGKRM